MLKRAMVVELDLKRQGYEVAVNVRPDSRWQCEISGQREIRAASIEDTWERAVIVAAENLAKGVRGPELGVL